MATIIRTGGGSSKPVRVEWIIGENQTINFKKGEFKYVEICLFGGRVSGTNYTDSANLYVTTSSGINRTYNVRSHTFTRETLELGESTSISVNAIGNSYIKGRIVIVLHNDDKKINWFSWY